MLSGGAIVEQPESGVEAAAALLRALSYGPRLRIAIALRDSASSPLALSVGLQMDSTRVAHHLRHLRTGGAVRRQRQGSKTVYVLAPGVGELLDLALAQVSGLGQPGR